MFVALVESTVAPLVTSASTTVNVKLLVNSPVTSLAPMESIVVPLVASALHSDVNFHASLAMFAALMGSIAVPPVTSVTPGVGANLHAILATLAALTERTAAPLVASAWKAVDVNVHGEFKHS